MLDIYSYIRYSLSALLALLLALLLAGCRGIDLPYSFSRDNGSYKYTHPERLTPAMQFALLAWYLDGKEALPADLSKKIQAVQEDAAKAVNLRLAEQIVKQVSPFARLDARGGLKFDSTYFADRVDWQDNSRILAEVRELLTIRKLELADLGELDTAPSQEDAKALTEFRSWFIVNTVVIAETAPLNRQELLATLDKIQDVLSLKRHLLDSLSEAKALLAAGNGLTALDLLEKASQDLSANSSLAVIGDVKTLAEFEQFRKELPSQLIDSQMRAQEASLSQAVGGAIALSSLEDFTQAQNKLLALEKIFSDSFRSWRKDSRFQSALNESAERFASYAEMAAGLRGTIWTGEIKMLAGRKEYWTMTRQIQSYRQDLQEKSTADFELYFSFKDSKDTDKNLAEKLDANLQRTYREILPLALTDYCRLAEQAVNQDNNFGLGFLLGRVAQNMVASSANNDASLANESAAQLKLKKLSELTERSRTMLLGGENQRGLLRNEVRIKDMTSSTTGLGLTYSRDLERELGEILKRCATLCPLTSIGGQETEAGNNDYLVSSGVIAAFDCTEQMERSSMRSLIRHGPIQKIQNPNHVPAPPPHASIKQTSPYLYRQEELEQIITSKEIERIAHIRVFFNIKGPGVAELLEINQIYAKKFLAEQSHLFNDIKVKRVVEAYDQSELVVPEAAPVLVNDRIWSSGEMHDFTRKDSLRVLALKILYQIQAFPLTLAQRAEKFSQEGNLSKAAEFWGQCLALCELMKADGDILALLQLESLPEANCFAADLKALRQRQNDLSELQKSAGRNASIAANAFVSKELRR